MSASFRSHFRPASQDRTAPKDNRKPSSSRAPTKQSTPDDQPSKSVQHVSKLAKRSGRPTTSSERASHSTTTSTARKPSEVTAAHNNAAVTSKPSVTPSEVASAARPKRLSNRQDSLPPPTIRTPSLVSGSSASTHDSPRPNGLRKPLTLDRHSAHKHGQPLGLGAATMHSQRERQDDAFEDSVLGISMPATGKRDSQDRYRAVVTPSNAMTMNFQVGDSSQDLTPPVPGFSQSATPSSRYTDSPFSHAPTPSSMSSYSPSVYITSGGTPLQQPPSPARSRAPTINKPFPCEYQSRLGLPPVRESSTSSSNATVKATEARPKAAKPAELAKKSVPVPTPQQRLRSTKSSSAKIASTARKPTAAPAQLSKSQKQIPPELAHLNVDPPAKHATEKPLPPLRPSRNNTPSITDFKAKSSVVQSDLPHLYTTYHKRTPSQETPVSGTSPSLRSRFGFSSRSSSRQPSPRIDSAVSPTPSSRELTRGPTPDSTRSDRPRLLRKDSPVVGATTGPSPSKSPRFGFLSRKSKVETKTTEKPKRESRKGPAAGTGHEYYGRFAFRGRSGSTSSSIGFGRSPSSDSSASADTHRPNASRTSSSASKDGPELDDFLKQRLNPVVLRGSGSAFSERAQNVVPSMQESSSSVSLDSLAQPQLLPSAMSNDRGMSPAKRLPHSRREPVDSSEDDTSSKRATLAARRSLNRLQSAATDQIRVPPPINTQISNKPASIDSYDAETSAWPQTDSTLPEEAREGKEGLWLRPQKSEPAVKPARKWNFFERTHPAPRKGKSSANMHDRSTAADRNDPSFASMAHYAMLDPPKPIGLEELERIIQEPDSSTEDTGAEDRYIYKTVPYDFRHVGLLPSPVAADFRDSQDFRAESTPPRIMVRTDSNESPELLRARMAKPARMAQIVDIPRSPLPEEQADHEEGIFAERKDAAIANMARGPLTTPELPQANGSPRQPRLSPIGRIPPVVSRRDRDRRLPDNSFSRPFANTQPRPSVRPPGSLYNQIRELASPVDPGSQPVSSTSGRSESASTAHQSSINTEVPTASTNRTSADYYAGNEFMSFTPRKNSELTYSSSSGNGSWMAPILAQRNHEDDVWHEYNDLMDDVIPLKTPVSAGSSLGAPFQYADMLQGNPSPSVPAPLSFGKPPSQQPTAALPLPPHAQQETVLPALSDLSRFLKPSLSPLTPDTLSHFVGTYGDRSTDSFIAQDRQSISQDPRLSVPMHRASVSSSRYSRASGYSRSTSLPEANARLSQVDMASSTRRPHDSQLLDIAEHDADITSSEVNLRLGALMTSKWLSFGRVLFSPAHSEMQLSTEPRILIVDGLGDDWSHYVAMTYPNAAVYNLGTSPRQGSSVPRPSEWRSVPNHRHINHPSLSSPFPFPKGFFAAVVFRFPVAVTDQTYQASIFECKRVLRPGGHLEVAVLDLDLSNMGTRTRRAVRGLKTRMQAHDANVSLRNMSDILVRLIGRRGFEDVQRCVVGVPAAGRIPRSQSSSSSSSGSGRRPSWDREERVTPQDLNFAHLLQNTRGSRLDPDRTNDESITKMVAKVGRFWYSACYEKALLRTDKTIWSEPGLLRECVKQGTSFRLLICCAQKPTQTRRRTVSV